MKTIVGLNIGWWYGTHVNKSNGIHVGSIYSALLRFCWSVCFGATYKICLFHVNYFRF